MQLLLERQFEAHSLGGISLEEILEPMEMDLFGKEVKLESGEAEEGYRVENTLSGFSPWHLSWSVGSGDIFSLKLQGMDGILK